MSDTVVKDDLENGLGLEKLIPNDKPVTKPSPKKAVSPEKVEGTKEPVKAPEAKSDKSAEPVVEDLPTQFAKAQKQLKDTRDWATRINNKLAKLEQENKDLQAKVDGTYVEKEGPSPQELAELAAFQARVKVDTLAMADKYGADKVQQMIWDADSQYMQLEASDPAVAARIRKAERPVQEAFKVLEERAFYEKYGNDILSAEEKMRAELRAEVEKEVRGELQGKKTIDDVKSLSKVSGVPKQSAPKATDVGPLKPADVFPLFKSSF